MVARREGCEEGSNRRAEAILHPPIANPPDAQGGSALDEPNTLMTRRDMSCNLTLHYGAPRSATTDYEGPRKTTKHNRDARHNSAIAS